MKIAFTTKEPSWDSMMEPRFGRAEYIVLYDEESGSITTYNNADIANQEHGAGPKMVKVIADMNADVVITGNGPGENARVILEKMKTIIFVGAGDLSVSDAYKAYQENKLDKF